jgi:hypothetical protein
VIKRICAGLLLFLGIASIGAQPATIYADIQMMQGWTAKTGASIGGVAPQNYSFLQGMVPGSGTGLLLFADCAEAAAGTPDCDWLLGLAPLPLPPTFTGKMTFGYTVTMGAGWSACGHAWESDTKVVTGGYVYDLSSQNKNGDIEIDSAAPAWVDTTINVGPWAANTAYSVLYTYAINTAAHTSSVVSYTLAGDVYPVPLALQNIPAKPSNWLPGIYPQFQQDGLPLGCWMYTLVDHVIYTVS